MTAGALHDRLEEFRRRYGVPAVGAALTDRHRTVEVAATGVRRRGESEAVTTDELWHIGSCAKSITATLYARLVERGEASWEATVPELFPDLAAGLDRSWAEVTVTEVLVHRSGLRANLPRPTMASWQRDRRPLPEQRTEAIAAALMSPPRGRGRFRYANLGYVLVGAAIERITQASYEEALLAHVLQPLGITTAGFGVPPGAWGHRGRVPLAHLVGVSLGRGAAVGPHRPESDNPAVLTPAGRVHLSLADWARFQRMVLDNGAELLRPETVARMLAPASGPGLAQAMGWALVRGRPELSIGQQGSNLLWAATALVDRSREHAAMVVTNDGRTRLLTATANLAATILAEPRAT